MPDFPYEEVYEHFARPLVEVGLGTEVLSAMMALALTEGQKVIKVDMLPNAMVRVFFSGPEGKEMLGRFIRDAIAKMPDKTCLVLITEAHWREAKSLEEAKEADRNGLKNDPKAIEVVMVSIYTRNGQQIGILPIKADRTLEYQPMERMKKAAGRLTTNPNKEDLL